MEKELILQGIKKELESIGGKGNQVNQIGFMMQTMKVHQKQMGELLASQDYSEHIIQINTLVKQLMTLHEKELEHISELWKQEAY